MWSVFGGFLLHALLCNWLTLLVKPIWEEPVRTIEDLLERDMGLILLPYNDYYIDVMAESPVENYKKEIFKSQIY